MLNFKRSFSVNDENIFRFLTQNEKIAKKSKVQSKSAVQTILVLRHSSIGREGKKKRSY